MKKVVAILLLTLVICVTAVGCGHNPDGGKIDDNIPGTDKFWTSGFTKDETTPSEMINEFIGCTMQSLKTVSGETVPSKASKIGINIKAAVEYNGAGTYAVLKSNYNNAAPNDAVTTVELFGTDNDVLIGVYIFKDSAGSRVYIKMNDNKICIPLSQENTERVLPLDLQFSSDASNLVASGFLLFMSIDGNIDYEYKNQGAYCERHFRFSVDIMDTFKKLFGMNEEWQNNMGISADDLDTIVKNLFGVSKENIVAGQVPQCDVVIEFSTIGGNPDVVGQGKLSSLKADVDMASSTDGDTVFGTNFDLSVDASQIVLSNSLQDLPKETAFADYVNYFDRIFKVYADFTIDAETYDVTCEFKYDNGDADKSEFIIKAVGRESKTADCTVYYKNKYIYCNWILDGKEYNVEGQFDLNGFFTSLKNHLAAQKEHEEENIGLIKKLCYIIGNLRVLDDSHVSYRFVTEFFYDIATLDSETMLTLIDENSDQDESALLSDQDTSIAVLFREFTVQIAYDEAIIEVIDRINFPTVCNKLPR